MLKPSQKRTGIISKNIGSALVAAVVLAMLGSVYVFAPARADVAPPESPPGVVISPGTGTTQVRMVSEVVTLELLPGNDQPAKAQTSADFVMRNLGLADENIQVRFPLSFGEALFSPGVYPNINDFKVQVDGAGVATTTVNTPDANSGSSIPWATFPVKFPVGRDVKIHATYTAQGFGYDPMLSFRYILETGAGWKSTIGSGDIIVRLPYAASQQNIVIDTTSGFGQAAGVPSFTGNEARWHFENLEPTADQNFEASMIAPVYWNKILAARQYTEKNPLDGEGWGQLGKAIKEAIRSPKGFLREDPGGQQLFLEADQAYGKSVAILPKDSQWHYGYADLLWSHYEFSVYYRGSQNYSEVTRLAVEVQTAIQLNPDYQEAKDLANSISETLPWAISSSDKGFEYLILTATPTYVPPTPTPKNTVVPAISTLPGGLPGKSPGPRATETVKPGSTPIPPVPVAKNPFCGSILVMPFLLGMLWLFARRR